MPRLYREQNKSQGVCEKNINYFLGGVSLNFYRTYKIRLYPTPRQQQLLLQLEKTYAQVYHSFLKLNRQRLTSQSPLYTTAQMEDLYLRIRPKYPALQQLSPEWSTFALKRLSIDMRSRTESPLLLEEPTPPVALTCFERFQIQPTTMTLPDLPPIKYRDRRSFGVVSSLSIRQYEGEWYAFLASTRQATPSPSASPRVIGIDVGLNDFAILSSGATIPNPRFYREWEEKLRREQRKLSSKQKGSQNYLKQQAKVKKIHQKIHQLRMNFLHKITRYLVDHYDIIGVEKLAIQKMMGNRKFAKSIADASWGEFIRLLRYKAAEQSKSVIEVGRFYPSSQLCSSCGASKWMPLHLRTYECAACGTTLDRDYNASKNIALYAEKKANKFSQK